MVRERMTDAGGRQRRSKFGCVTADERGLQEADSARVNGQDGLTRGKWPRVVQGSLVFKGKLNAGDAEESVNSRAAFSSPAVQDPELAEESFGGAYDGLFPETQEHKVSSSLRIKGAVKTKGGSKTRVKGRMRASGSIFIEEIPKKEYEQPQTFETADLFAPYDAKLAKFAFLIGTLSNNCASYVLEDMRRLLYLRNGRLSRNPDMSSRKEACRSLARLAMLRKVLEEVEEHGARFSKGSSSDASLEMESSLGGALAYRSADGKHPAVYIQLASLFPTSLYLQITPAEMQRILLRVFNGVWQKLAVASRRHTEKISHVAVVLDFSGLSQLDVAAYSTHRLLGDVGEVLRAYCPWLIYKIILFKLNFAKDLVWELFRPALQADCRIVSIEDDTALVQEIQPDGPFILHTLGGFNESSFLRCRRPVYRVPQPPQPLGSGDWFAGGDAIEFWEEMKKLHIEAPWAAPEPEPVDDTESQNAEMPPLEQPEERESALERKTKELQNFINRRECLIPHFNNALKEVLNALEKDKDITYDTAGMVEPSRPLIDLNDVTRADVRVCMWKPPANASQAARSTAQMLLKIFEGRRQWNRPPLPPNFMHAFERTTYSLDCVYVSLGVLVDLASAWDFSLRI
ncbi:uncharacterized protein LOC34619002 [Cyclospora cayetanensis]|uniref:Uncharacterized protein LOC34619002 n=1 Tax=Cyclospora cayetanensis TaxID=88456 RepID=A0A6P6RS50_9EIME|nr:uncharacterized protein LOC34619002 [Cyclospora cayetanensis]